LNIILIILGLCFIAAGIYGLFDGIESIKKGEVYSMEEKRTFRKEDSPKTFMFVVCAKMFMAILVGLGGGIGMIAQVFRN
tara:strand:+ start:317 stop:556 length:240 start_codon:yes stop_codon:yes gene_type:complete